MRDQPKRLRLDQNQRPQETGVRSGKSRSMGEGGYDSIGMNGWNPKEESTNYQINYQLPRANSFSLCNPTHSQQWPHPLRPTSGPQLWMRAKPCHTPAHPAVLLQLAEGCPGAAKGLDQEGESSQTQGVMISCVSGGLSSID